MHELSITQEIVEIVTTYASGMPVRKVILQIGKLSGVVPDAIRFYFDVCTEGTLVAGATLEIEEPIGLGCCRQCGEEMQLDIPFGVCRCNSIDLAIVRGEELTVIAVETDALCV